jgi:hypothetical protein
MDRSPAVCHSGVMLTVLLFSAAVAAAPAGVVKTAVFSVRVRVVDVCVLTTHRAVCNDTTRVSVLRHTITANGRSIYEF